MGRWGDHGDNEGSCPHDFYYPLIRPPSGPSAASPGVRSALIHPDYLSCVVFHRLLNPLSPGTNFMELSRGRNESLLLKHLDRGFANLGP